MNQEVRQLQRMAPAPHPVFRLESPEEIERRRRQDIAVIKANLPTLPPVVVRMLADVTDAMRGV